MVATLETTDRQAILAEIAECENRLFFLRMSLPPAIKTFYQFRLVRPAQSKILIYANSRAEAEAKLHARLDQEHGKLCWTVQAIVKTFVSADDAALNGSTGSSLLSCLTPADAIEFVKDFEESQKSRATDQNTRKSQVERDVEQFKLQRQRKDADSQVRNKQHHVGSTL